MLVSVEQLKKETNQTPEVVERDKAFKEAGLTEEAAISPEEKPLIDAITKGNVLTKEENLEKRKEMIEAIAFEPTQFALERSIGDNDSLYSNFTELIALTKRKVGKINIREKNKNTGCATGFMVSGSLLLTNWHVFKNEAMAAGSEVQFFYELDVAGHPTAPVIFKLDTPRFFTTNEDLDYCFVAVQPVDITGKISLESISYLYLDKALGKIGEVNKEKLNIIHHPQGDYKQISIRANLFVDINDTRIFYETDTAQGSSGSPVFNDQWQVVGLHHKSIAKMSADEKQYLDKDTGQPIPVTPDGKIDVTRVKWLKNEGMRISVILKHLAETHPGNSVVSTLDVPPPKETLFFTTGNNDPSFETKNNSAMNSDKNININVPVSALSSDNSIEISLSTKKIVGAASVITSDIPQGSAAEELLLEVKKVEKEQGVDFSNCRGYDPVFLGIEVPLPQPKKSIEKQIAVLKNKTNELKYFKYSVIFNSFRKMPLISAVNVEGDAKKRLDNSKRKDDWLRDKRIDIEGQLTDKFYASSGFDKGHMSRFEDANWDTTEEKAFRNGIYTCLYTNACPQVPGINRMGDNLWGKLEKAILEKGVKKESGPQARMTVFNGPVFDDDKDRMRLGTTVPMQFYKIILWLDDNGKLKATAFKLSQELLVTDDQFNESMTLGEEAIDIDKLVAYKKYQCSIASLGKLTHINFSHIQPFDTFKTPAGGGDEVMLANEEEIML
jgi:endonuclease G